MNYWLLKSEPDVWSIDQQKKAGVKGVAWDGVRNYQAANNLKKMKRGDLRFFITQTLEKKLWVLSRSSKLLLKTNLTKKSFCSCPG